jgi:hypothetical protein
MAQQTAVEWLIEQVNSEQYQIAFGQTYISIDLIQQAKAMEKEQIMKAVDRGFDEGCKFPEDMTLSNSEQYYNETYKQ